MWQWKHLILGALMVAAPAACGRDDGKNADPADSDSHSTGDSDTDSDTDTDGDADGDDGSDGDSDGPFTDPADTGSVSDGDADTERDSQSDPVSDTALSWDTEGPVDTDGPPVTVSAGLFDQGDTDDLGLSVVPGAQTVTVFAPSDDTNHFSNGVVMVGFNGRLYCQWQSSDTNEDSADTRVVYSRSDDGVNWSSPMSLGTCPSGGYCSSGGWWVAGDTLMAYINYWPQDLSPRGGETRFTTSADGLTWTPLQSLPMAGGGGLQGIFEQDPHLLPGGRIIGAAHFQPGLIASPILTDDPTGQSGWTRASFANLSHAGDVSREIEPSSFRRRDGGLVMVFRDQEGSYAKLASLSADRGLSWTTPVLTDMPDARTKQCAGNLPDGTAYLVGNPRNTNIRTPLVITLSDDGKNFDRAFVLRRGSDLQQRRYDGTAKTVGYNYPKATLWDGSLYVSYATNKEDVEFTRIPVSDLITP